MSSSVTAMSRNTTQSIANARNESIGSFRQQTSSARGERSASNPASFAPDPINYDTALPPITFQPASVAHRRTGSTLKTVMRKIFTRRRQSQAEGLEENPDESFYTTPPPRRSGPAGVGKSFLTAPTPVDAMKGSPLSGENVQLTETHLSPTAMSADSAPSGSLHPRRRRATLPSAAFSDDESRYAVASSAASDPQEDRPYMPDQQHRRSILDARRRSRSTDALRALADEQPVSPAAWPPRAKSTQTSVPDSKSPPFEGSCGSGQSARPSTPTTVTSVTRASAEPSLVGSDHQAEQASLPPNVGNLVSTMHQDDGVTLEQRLTTLEVKMIDLEFAVARMQSNSVENPHPERSSRHKHSTDSLSPHVRNQRSGYLGAADHDESPTPLTNATSARPISTTTIRPETQQSRPFNPAASATSLADLHGVSIEQYSALVTLLRREQTARRNLEGQVTGLRDDIRHLQRAALNSMELGTMYPIHSVESQEFLRFRRALDGSDTSLPIRIDEKPNGGFDDDSDWDRSDSNGRDETFGHPKWERGQRSVITPMI